MQLRYGPGVAGRGEPPRCPHRVVSLPICIARGFGFRRYVKLSPAAAPTPPPRCPETPRMPLFGRGRDLDSASGPGVAPGGSVFKRLVLMNPEADPVDSSA